MLGGVIRHDGQRRAVVALGWLLVSTVAHAASAQTACFKRLDNGVDMTGWHPSTTNHHGPGTGWTVENGAFVGRQTTGQLGGILLTNQVYKDVEVIFEVKITWGCDSGFFFRTTAGDRAYQVTLDHLAESGVGTIYGEGFTTELRAIPYWLTNQGNSAVPAPGQTPMFDLSQWASIWHPTEFNELRARVEGNPPHIQVWVGGLAVMNFTDSTLRSEIDAAGPLAIQVHGGADRWLPGGTVQFRNIRVKDLTVACTDPGPSMGGTSGTSVGGTSVGGTGVGGTGGTSGTAGLAGAARGGVGGRTSDPLGDAAAGSDARGGVGAASMSEEGGSISAVSAGAGEAGTSGKNSAPKPSSVAERTSCACALRPATSDGPAWLFLSLLMFAALRRTKGEVLFSSRDSPWPDA